MDYKCDISEVNWRIPLISVQEYWIVDPVHEVVEVWQSDNKRFTRVGAFAHADTFESRPLNLAVEVKDIFSI